MILLVYVVCLLLHCVVPARVVKGYCCDEDGIPLNYRLNGIAVYIVMTILFLQLPRDNYIKLFESFWSNLIIVNVLGISASTYFLIKGGKAKYLRCITVDQIQSDDFKKKLTPAGPAPPLLTRFFLGCEWNPRILGVDIKMFLYLVGAVGLQLNILSCMFANMEMNNGKISNAMALYVALMGWFLTEYLLGEEVHLYTYDLFAEKIGFKLVWGCLVFYPFFYSISIAPLITFRPSEGSNSDLSPLTMVAIVGLFLSGWALTRGANMQKFWSRTQPQVKFVFFGLVPQRTLPGTRILVSGWWGLSRHINYLGEIVQALAVALPGCLVAESAMMRVVPLLYPLYYLLLFVPRQIDDDAVCKAKYGAIWDEYVKQVPYRIFPGVW